VGLELKFFEPEYEKPSVVLLIISSTKGAKLFWNCLILFELPKLFMKVFLNKKELNPGIILKIEGYI
jgi:hypothetical protein